MFCLLFAFHFCAWSMNHVLFHSWKAGMGVLLIPCLGCIFGRDTQLLQINKGVTEAKLVYMSKGCNLWSSARNSPWPYSFEKSNFKQKSTWLSIKHILLSGWGFALAGFFPPPRNAVDRIQIKNLIAKKDPSAKCLSSSVRTCPWMMS